MCARVEWPEKLAVLLGGTASAPAPAMTNITDFVPSRYCSGTQDDAVAFVWELHERLRQAYVFVWSLPLTRRVLATASHVMVGGGADLGIDDQVVSVSSTVEPESKPAFMKSALVAAISRHLYDKYQRQLVEPRLSIVEAPAGEPAGPPVPKEFEVVGGWDAGLPDIVLQVRVLSSRHGFSK